MKRVLLGLLLAWGLAQADTTSNLLNGSWSGAANYSGTGAGTSGGNVPGYNSTNNTIYFGYTQATVAQTIAINNALQGSGVRVGGVQYGFTYMNDPGAGGNLSTTVNVTSNTGALLHSYPHTLPYPSNGWVAFNQTQTFTNPYALTNMGNVSMQITGKDNRFWAGYYGPQVRDPYLQLNYTVDPCVGNPRHSPSCPGFNDANMWYTGDVTSVYGLSFAINQALGFGNTGVRVHSVNWGYDYSIGGRWCDGWNLFGICFSWADSSVTGSLDVRNSSNQSIVTDSQTTSGENISGSFRREVKLGDVSRDIATLGTASINISTVGVASATPFVGFYFTPDICNTNPLVNAQCPGYAAAYFTQQCNANPLYDAQCPGYAAAYFTQQCNANQLYSPACPGYAAAYLSFQCSQNPLYAPQCPGYEQAYLDQQCSINPLYSTQCAGYTQASTQCSINPLYASYCPGYQTASTNCSINSLYASYCPGYTAAQTTCSLNPLSNTLCGNYQTATAQCNNNQLSYSYCPNYTATLQYCSTDPLSNPMCPTYQASLTQCNANPLSNSYCPGYQTAVASCSANSLNHTYCPGYQIALNNCSTNPLSNTLCSGYQTATQVCSNNQLTYTYCPSYKTALASCATNTQSNSLCPGYSSQQPSSQPSGSIQQASTSSPTPSISSDGTVSTTVSKTGDSNVDKAIAAPSPATNSAAAPAAPVQLNTPQPQAPAAAMAERRQEPAAQQTTMAPQGGQQDQQSKDQPKTARQEMQERRVQAARTSAAQAGKEAADKVGNANSLEAQKQVQGIIIQAMGFTPGFDAYNRAFIPDSVGYKPFTVYNNQANVDNRRLGNGLYGPSDRLHKELVDSQYQLQK